VAKEIVMKRLLLLACLATPLPLLAQPAPEAAAAKPAKVEKVLTDLRFDNVALTDAIEYLRDVTGENIVVFVDPDVDLTAIRLTMKLKNVTFPQVANLLASVPDARIEINQSENTGDVFIVSVKSLHENRGAGGGGGFGGGGYATQAPATESGVVSVLPVFDTYSGDEDREKTVTNTVTTMLDAIVASLGDGGKAPVVRFHPQSRLIFFRGTPQQVAEINAALTKFLEADAQQQTRNAMATQGEERRSFAELQQKYALLANEYAALRQRLAATGSEAVPSTQPTR
jgi:hypothetical protein